MLKDTLNIHGKLLVHNRLVMPPMATAKSDPNGLVTEDLLSYYKVRANGGKIGLIITEHTFIEQRGKARAGQMSLADDGVLDGQKRLNDLLHECGSKTAAQLNHAGAATSREHTGMGIVAPSAVKNPFTLSEEELPRALTVDEILALEDAYVEAAKRAKKAGYDAVEIHSAHGYLLNQFLSPLTNKREDDYGAQCIENRVRIHAEILKKVREEVGQNYPILVRLGGCDYLPGGSTIEDAAEAAKILCAAGVDMIDISGGHGRFDRPDHKEPGWFSDQSRAVKNVVDVPVMLTGGITTAAQAEELLVNGDADLIGVGRAILKEPDWARKEM